MNHFEKSVVRLMQSGYIELDLSGDLAILKHKTGSYAYVHGAKVAQGIPPRDILDQYGLLEKYDKRDTAERA
jgi:hypothetical protein